MSTETDSLPILRHDETTTVGTAQVACPACGVLVPISAEMWLATDEEGDTVVALDSDIRDLELHAAVHRFEAEEAARG